MNDLPSPEGQTGQERQCLKETQREPTLSQNVTFRVHFDCPGIRQMGLCNHNGSWFKICRLKEGTIYHDPVAISRNESSIKASGEKKAQKKRDISGMPIIPICDKCNKTVWVGGKKESTFVVYFQEHKRACLFRFGETEDEAGVGFQAKETRQNSELALYLAPTYRITPSLHKTGV
ncbi:hypothetical protein DUI87_03874 [Hirundo rustica rustica]|uniref:Uncharacterized protein n=1 Tax=Hirundo rustica rustica TaxID=333673 RepID=A0A3M0LJJ9_HIRRU|nr:hypothetical protein DUI87_03874 [Hirundo rustica rustica]